MDATAARRLTGPNLWLPTAGAAIEVAFSGADDPEAAYGAWCASVRTVADWLGWPPPEFARSDGADCATWAFSAPLDQLGTAAECAEAACSAAPPGPSALPAWRARAAAEANPRTLAWVAAAEARELPWLLDDDGLSIGLGHRGRTWPLTELPPDVALLADWGSIPHALITGTNGKTTTARLLARILRHGGYFAGNTATDGWMLDGALIMPGDWTGPGGARHVLRHPRVQAAALETARGGFLRRGLATVWADVAVVTNVSDDHLDAQVPTVAAMAAVKLAIRRGIRPGGTLVLNAGCADLVAAALALGLPDGPYQIAWFALRFSDFRDLPGTIRAWPLDGALVVEKGRTRTVVAHLDAIACTFGGAALHNVANALAATLAADAMAVAPAAIAEGLAAFGSTLADNPGRANLLQLGGATVLVDFAHNPDGVRQVAALIDRWPSRRRTLLLGQAGDRSDALMHAFVRAALFCRPDRVVLKDTDHYLRGRRKGEITAVLAECLRAEGVAETAIEIAADEPAGIAACLRDAAAGDLLILLIHDDFLAGIAQLRAAGAGESGAPASPSQAAAPALPSTP